MTWVTENVFRAVVLITHIVPVVPEGIEWPLLYPCERMPKSPCVELEYAEESRAA